MLMQFSTRTRIAKKQTCRQQSYHFIHLNRQKTKVCVVNLLAANFSDRGIKGLREKVNETQVSQTVFSRTDLPH